MVKILHIADVHLDSPFSLYDLEKAKARKEDLRKTFSAVVDYSINEKVDILIISGDLFDMEFVTDSTIKYLVNEIKRAKNVRFIITPGNHDFYCAGGIYDKAELPENAFVFTKGEIERYSFDDIETDVYGFGFTSESHERDMLAYRFNLNKDHLNIFACHADLGVKNSKYCPITTDDIAKSRFDYVALGHIHKGTGVAKEGKTLYAYPGCLEGRSFDECGTKGGIVLEFEKGRDTVMDTIWEPKVNYQRFNVRRYEKVDCDITNVQTRNEAIKKIQQIVSDKGFDKNTLLRVTFSGVVSVNLDVEGFDIKSEEVGVYYLETKDNTIPMLNNEDLLMDITLKGVFYRELKAKLESKDEKERELATKALKYGMEALSGYKSSDM